MTDEQRRFTRIRFNPVATLKDPRTNEINMVELQDISLKGVLISKPAHWAGSDNEHYNLQLQLAGDDVEINLQLISVHCEENIIGFKTQKMDIDTATHLHRLLELNLGDESLLERELTELVNSN